MSYLGMVIEGLYEDLEDGKITEKELNDYLKELEEAL